MKWCATTTLQNTIKLAAGRSALTAASLITSSSSATGASAQIRARYSSPSQIYLIIISLERSYVKYWSAGHSFTIIIRVIHQLQKKLAVMQPDPQVSTEQCKYTLSPITNSEHREKLEKFIQSRGKLKDKSSLCRFYLRGICIMKKEYCKFAHSVQELSIDTQDSLFYLSDKERKKREFVEKKEFNQTALFILKNVRYHVLYEYQFSDRYKKREGKVYDLDTISTDRAARIRIREIMHREQWDGFIDFLESRFPHTNYPISFISYWYANFGFDKPQTRCKFGDFLKYATHVRKYVQVDIVFPPNAIPSIFMVNSVRRDLALEQNIDFIYDHCMKGKQLEGKQKMDQFLELALPEQLSKKYICRYFMAGNCQLPAEQCLYAHSIDELSTRHELDQEFPVAYRQPVIPIELRMNFVSLYESTRKYPEYQQYSLQDINLNTTIRNELRQRIHHELFADFMKYLEGELGPRQTTKFFQVELKELHRLYSGAGFNHTNENKFQHLESALWDLGYYMEDLVTKDQLTLEKKKTMMVYKIPPLDYLNQQYCRLVRQCVSSEVGGLGDAAYVLESALKRIVYGYEKEEQILPLHVYLRYRGCKFQDLINEYCTKEEVDKIFFESGEENMKKASEIVKKYMKKNKQCIVKIETIENYLKQEKKDQVNLNHHFVSLRTVVQNAVVDSGRRIYFWPFSNNYYALDAANLPAHRQRVEAARKNYHKDQSYDQFAQHCTDQHLMKQRIIVVDSFARLSYARQYLASCGVMGVDLEGRLRTDGYVDLVQVSGAKRDKQGKIEHKQIFIFDIWLMTQDKISRHPSSQGTQTEQNQVRQRQLLSETKSFLKSLFEDKSKVKILHDCHNDSIALKHVLGISITNVFDTSGFDVYLNQRKAYESEKHPSGAILLRKIYDVRIPGLNTILDTYKAPNGVNIFKESMKKKFGEESRAYFEARPIDEEFLEYSARDVEDLIEVYETMLAQDTEYLAEFVGELYSTF